MEIRPANSADAHRIAEIWNPVIRDSTVTFNSIEKAGTEIAALINDRINTGHAFFVACSGDEVLGFATYSQFRSGVGYAHTMEHTIILADDARGKGVGRALMIAIEKHAKNAGAHSMIAGVSAENTAAIAFHERIGYPEIARIPDAGRKFGRLIATVFLQKIL